MRNAEPKTTFFGSLTPPLAAHRTHVHFIMNYEMTSNNLHQPIGAVKFNTAPAISGEGVNHEKKTY